MQCFRNTSNRVVHLKEILFHAAVFLQELLLGVLVLRIALNNAVRTFCKLAATLRVQSWKQIKLMKQIKVPIPSKKFRGKLSEL